MTIHISGFAPRVAVLAVLSTLLAGCTLAEKNAVTCEQLMHSRFATVSPNRLVVSHAGVGIGGSRVVVEGEIEYLEPSPALAPAASASAVSAVSAAAVPQASFRPKTLHKPIAAECTFKAAGLASFNWLAPRELVKTKDEPESDDSSS
ncbi:hypothetical protein QS306_05400 [Paraburkholderia bonniea]|uniref:hypothetical protein n=1 Tax=Paraburkholderia bonniea TaxID=2152891 RepID=UPI0012911F5D|nr:hypothetical protein [Paraburkholderia bonniea]WJF91080.1 hypothetical protein QS306_05400 [Paraburkholderia bonniea]WJF94395.1 hypothetical protein QS308_05405 [Paraburkholderia bonniea]